MPLDKQAGNKPESGVDETHAEMTEARRQLDDLGHAFNEFSETLKTKADAESVSKATAELEAKLDRIGDAMDAAEEKLAALEEQAVIRKASAEAENERSPEEQRYYDAWTDVLKGVKGAENNLLSARQDLKTGGSSTGGGEIVVDPDLDRMIRTVYSKNSPLRQNTTVYQVRSGEYEAPLARTLTGGGWGTQGSGTPSADAPAITKADITLHKLWARPEVTTEFLQDTFIDVREFIAMQVGRKFVELEGAAFISGSGTNEPEGILSATTVANGSYKTDTNANYAKIGYIKTGHASKFPDPAANAPSYRGLIDMQEALQVKYTGMDQDFFLMSKPIRAVIRKLTQEDHISVWEPSLQIGVPSRLLGSRVVIDDNMTTALAANAYIVAYMAAEAFVILEKGGIQMLVDPYTKPSHVRYMTSMRCGGGIVNYEAIKLLRCEA